MNIPSLILAILVIAVAAGGVAAWFSKGSGKETIELLQTNISAYKDAEKLKDQRISYLEAQVYDQQETIKKLSRKS